MTIQLRFNANLDPIERARTGFRKVTQLAEEIGRKVAQETEINLVSDLQTPAGPVQYPIAWTSDKQRKAFFATDGFGSGIPYTRTGNLTEAWTVLFQIQGNAMSVVVENTAPAARFVYGSLSQNLTAAARFQQQFHKNTGWPLASPLVRYWLTQGALEWRRQLVDRLSQEVGIVIQQQSYTSPRRP